MTAGNTPSARQEIALAMRLLVRDWRAGELALLAAALVIAVASLTTVGFFTDRVRQALLEQSNQLLGADLTIASERPLDPAFAREAAARGLAAARTQRFPSMVAHGADSALTDIKAVSAGYPLRGEVRIADSAGGAQHAAGAVPAPGTAWADPRLAARFDLKIGDTLTLGQVELRVAAWVMQEPDSADIGFFNSMPRLLVNEADLAASGLIQTGSRVRYRFYVAGAPGPVGAYAGWARAHAAPWQNIEGAGEGRPMLRNALARAQHFLGLAALIAAVIAAAAIALAARRFCMRHGDACAIMRCLGARRAMVVRLYALHLLVFGVLASAVGCALGYAAQAVLAHVLAGVGPLTEALALPPPTPRAALQGMLAGIALLAACALPPLAALGGISTLRVLRRETVSPAAGAGGAAAYVLGGGIIAGLIAWQGGEARLAAYAVGGFAAAVAAAALCALLAIHALARLRGSSGWRLGLANLRRRMAGSTLQIVALAIGLAAILTLTVIRGDLLRSWRETLPPDAPNRFLVGIQPEQVAPVLAFFSDAGMVPPVLQPMVRGRLVEINGRAISSDDYQDGRARRMLDREFNLSWMRDPPNPLSAGRWWRDGEAPGQWSVEEGLASTLGLKMGDRLTYDIAGVRVGGTITSLRRVDWDSLRVNFFVIAPPPLLRDYAASYLSSLRVEPAQAPALNGFTRAFPNVVIVDLDQILAQIQRMIAQVAGAMEFIFLFTLAAGIAVLYAALASTRDEREYEAAVMRALGASRRQILLAQCAEFAAIGTIAGALAAAAAAGLGRLLAARVLDVPYHGTPWLWLWGMGCGALGVTLAGWLGTRRVLGAPPMRMLRAGE